MYFNCKQTFPKAAAQTLRAYDKDFSSVIRSCKWRPNRNWVQICTAVYLLSMQCFWLVPHGIFHKSLVFSRYMYIKQCVYQEDTIEKLNILWYMYIMRKHSITTCILYLAIESGQHNQCNLCTAHSGKVGCNSIERLSVFCQPVFSMAWYKVQYCKQLSPL